MKQIHLCDYHCCKRLYAQDKVRRALEKEWNTLTSSPFGISKHFASGEDLVNKTIRVSIKPYYVQFDNWSLLN